MPNRETSPPVTAKEIARRTLLPTLPLYLILLFGVIALSHPNDAWTSAALTLAALLPLVAIVAGRFGAERSRPWRYGFAICCGGYFLFFTLAGDSPYMDNLATSKAIGAYYKLLFPKSTSSPTSGMPNPSGGFGGAFDVAPEAASSGKTSAQAGNRVETGMLPIAQVADAPVPTPDPAIEAEAARDFWLIGHSIWALIFGWLGGSFAQFLASRRKRETGIRASPTTAAPT